MEAFPFSQSEWSRVSDLANVLTNAAHADDRVLHQVYFIELQEQLALLAEHYGEHPTLIETEADFTHVAVERVELYEKAKRFAIQNQLPTLTIRISLARVLLGDFQQPAKARIELLACEHELVPYGDEYYSKEWLATLAACAELT